MSKLVIKGITREGCQVTILDHSSPHAKMIHHEIIMETPEPAEVVKLKTEEWENERTRKR